MIRIVIVLFFLIPYCISAQTEKKQKEDKTEIALKKNGFLSEPVTKDSLFRRIKAISASKVEIKKIPISFLNNPFYLDSDTKILVVRGHYILYDGLYSNHNIKLDVPLSLIGKKQTTQIYIFKRNRIYSINTAQMASIIDQKDNIIHVIFMPTNDSGSLYLNPTNFEKW